MALFKTDAPQLPIGFEYIPECIEQSKAHRLYQCLSQEIDWQQPKLRIFDKEHRIPRKQFYMGDAGCDYGYSGRFFKAEPWHPVLASLKEKLCQRFMVDLNVVLLNWYRDGNDRMGWHSDNEPELGNQPVIISISLGATRKFKIRENSTKQVCDVMLENGSALIMKGASQNQFQHSLPVQKRVNEGRINLTFRHIIKSTK